MQNNSKIYIKSRKDPITVSESQAQKISDVFFDDTISLLHPLSCAGQSFSKGEIKSIEVKKDSGEERHIPHWIIYHEKAGVVGGKGAYSSYQDARADYQFHELDGKGWEILQR